MKANSNKSENFVSIQIPLSKCQLSKCQLSKNQLELEQLKLHMDQACLEVERAHYKHLIECRDRAVKQGLWLKDAIAYLRQEGASMEEIRWLFPFLSLTVN